MVHGEWRIETDVDLVSAAEALIEEPAWTAYALGNLEPPFSAYAQVAVATSDSGWRGACMTLRHPAFNWMFSVGEADAVRQILGAITLPSRSLFSLPPEHLDAFNEHFDFPNGVSVMRRMLLDSSTVLQHSKMGTTATFLQCSNLGEMEALYRYQPDSSFTADHLHGGVFFGVRGENGLTAVAGTHVVSRRFRLAAVGSVLTHPDFRRQGLAAITTAAVVGELRGRGIETIVLNVAKENTTAAHVYERLGFKDFCAYIEGHGVLRTGN